MPGSMRPTPRSSSRRRPSARGGARGAPAAAAPPAYRLGASAIHGLGLFTVAPIAARRKLGGLSGELRRLPAARVDHQRRTVIQLVELSRRWALDCSAGNDFRHLNHSCGANCYLRIAGRRVEVYSRGRIRAGSELTVDYGQTMHRGGMTCVCGAPGCRARI